MRKKSEPEGSVLASLPKMESLTQRRQELLDEVLRIETVIACLNKLRHGDDVVPPEDASVPLSARD